MTSTDEFVVQLALEKSQINTGNLFLTWPAVSGDFDGNPTVVSHYEIWGSNTPITRQQIEAGSVELILPVVTQAFAEITPAAPNRYYSVIVVDARGNRSPF